MKATKVSPEVLTKAMQAVNTQYGGNLTFNRFDVGKNHVNFTLRVNSSNGKGHRLGHSGKRLVATCWHAHRDFLATLFDMAPNAKVVSCKAKYDGKDGFASEFERTGSDNIGSMFAPLCYRDACECER